MEQDLQTQTAAVEAPEGQPQASEESATPEPTAERADAAESSVMNALLRGVIPPPAQDSASKPDDQQADPEGTADTGGESAPPGDVKPSDEQSGRRGSAAEIKRLREENARLQKAYDEANPPPPDASEEARARAIATERRFRDLNGRASDDPVLYQQGEDGSLNADWLDGEKRRRSLAPELKQHYETVLDADRQAIWADAERREQAFLSGQARQILELSALPGVDAEAFKAAPYAVQGRMLYDAREPEIRRLKEEIAQLKRENLGGIKAAPTGGRSSPGTTFTENGYMNTLLRGGRS